MDYRELDGWPERAGQAQPAAQPLSADGRKTLGAIGAIGGRVRYLAPAAAVGIEELITAGLAADGGQEVHLTSAGQRAYRRLGRAGREVHDA